MYFHKQCLSYINSYPKIFILNLFFEFYHFFISLTTYKSSLHQTFETEIMVPRAETAMLTICCRNFDKATF